MKKRIVILGSTGSIGGSALRVAAALPARLEGGGLAARSNFRPLLQQAQEFGVRRLAVADPEAAKACAAAAPPGVTVAAGDAGVEALAELDEADIVLCAMVGLAGLKSVLAALRRGKDVALATKEVLVAAGPLVVDCAARHHARLLPVDSEHSAIFQCLEGRDPRTVKRLILTASGGPFASRSEVDFEKVTVAEALKHPRWNMGRKVTVDSATLMNKGLEIMEAHWLFGVPFDSIDVLIHPESIVHSMVEFVDGGVLAQLSPPDMRYAIQYALTWPERVDGGLPSLSPAGLSALHFHAPDANRFPCLELARRAAVTGGTLPAALNAANEEAVASFLDGGISFAGIWRTVEDVMNRHAVLADPSLEQIVEADGWARRAARELCLSPRGTGRKGASC
jgi:1-deoxy-D-xylulose-5-phosphate reductoisomerase